MDAERSAQSIALLVHPGAELFGSDRMLLESAIGLVEAGTRVVVALPSQGPLVNELLAVGAEVVIIPMLVLRKSLLTPRGLLELASTTFRGFGSGWRLLRRLRPDVVYVSTITIPQWPVLAKLRSIRAVSHVHEAEASGSRMINRALYLPHLLSHRVLVNSKFSVETIKHSLASLSRRAEIVYNGVASPAEPTPPRQHLLGPLRVLFIGRLSPRKGPDVVIRAAAALGRSGQPVAVTLLGTVFPGYEWFEAELRKLADEHDVNVTFAGFNTDIWPFLHNTDVLVVPSRVDEPFGNTAVEGVLAMRPVVASDSSGLREAAGGYETAKLITPNAPEALAAALTEIVATWSQINAAIVESRTEAQRRHAPEQYRRRIVEALEPLR